MGEKSEIRPQPGPQEQWLSSSADIAVYGGAAGGGKTYALLLEPLRHIGNPRFTSVIFRRESTQITNQGGLWDESMAIYPRLGATPNLSHLLWRFPSGAVVRFAHLQLEADKLAWQGAQVALIGFDELTHFTESQFLYLLSRNRSVSGVRPYMRATTNPDAESWVKRLLAPWVDDEHPDYPWPSGALRWFTHQDGAITWVTREWRDEAGLPGKSVAFVPARVQDNAILLRSNPEYLANLRALPLVEQERLLHGNWKVRAEAGKVFNRAWFEMVGAAPAGGRAVRFWDFAATAKAQKKDDPDWTVGLRLRRVDGVFYVEDVVRERETPAEVKRLVKAVATQDGYAVRVGFEVEGGSAGKFVRDEIVQLLAGWSVRGVRPSTDKVTRAGAASSQALAGNIKLVRGPWNAEFLAELHGFPDLAHDDQVDALSGAVNLVVDMGEALPAAQAVSREQVSDLLG